LAGSAGLVGAGVGAAAGAGWQACRSDPEATAPAARTIDLKKRRRLAAAPLLSSSDIPRHLLGARLVFETACAPA
jgi:hypothetical protein